MNTKRCKSKAFIQASVRWASRFRSCPCGHRRRKPISHAPHAAPMRNRQTLEIRLVLNKQGGRLSYKQIPVKVRSITAFRELLLYKAKSMVPITLSMDGYTLP